MNKLKTKKDTILLNFNDLAFFTNETIGDAKWKMAHHFYKAEDIECNLTKSGIPKLKKTDLVEKSDFETKMKSVFTLEGKNSIDFIIETYNKGITVDRLYLHSENKSFIKSLKFTGKHTILNEILNREQLRKLQKTWLFKNVYLVGKWSEKCKLFIQENEWCIG